MDDGPLHATSLAAVITLGQIDSTNSEAMRRITSGEMGPLWIRAEAQSRGRGRSGRSWTSEPGNLYATLLFAPGCARSEVHQLSLVTGVAVYDAIYAIAGGTIAGLRLKWPNDVLIGSAKAVGILAESTVGQGGELLAVVGVGINLAHAPADAGRGTTCLAEHGISADPATALAQLDRAMWHWLGTWDRGHGFAAIRGAWLDRAGSIGEMLAINAAEGRIEGRFAGLDADGSLLLTDAGGSQRRFLFGDVSVVAGAART
jgi:BirA family transcriptional regulator, biotin operon repressor / biotin---[acetyl-CoA-carboxylase] ligase